jgi:LysM repeat protein
MSQITGRVDLMPDKFDLLIQQKGMRILWEQAMICHCYEPNTGQPEFTCPTCHGTGFIYFDAKETVALSTNLSGKKDFDNIGMAERGTAYVTSLTKDLMGYHDRLTFLDFKCKYSQLVTFYNGQTPNLNRYIEDVMRLQDSEMTYVLGEHFKISDNKVSLEWIDPDTEPLNGSRMGILLVTKPRYHVIDIMHELRATQVKYNNPTEEFKELPKQYMIKREDFIYETSRDTSSY